MGTLLRYHQFVGVPVNVLCMDPDDYGLYTLGEISPISIILRDAHYTLSKDYVEKPTINPDAF